MYVVSLVGCIQLCTVFLSLFSEFHQPGGIYQCPSNRGGNDTGNEMTH